MAQEADVFVEARARLVEDIRRTISEIEQRTSLNISYECVLAAIGKVPRHEFVPAAPDADAYRNRPLPIGFQQTISQPLIVALMSGLGDISNTDRVLEVGTGSGYQAAVLGELAGAVYSVEIIEPLASQAAKALKRLGYDNVHMRVGDGYTGWPEYGPYDAIIVTAAPDHIPSSLIEQLKPGGRLVIPVGDFDQQLMVVEKLADGSTREHDVIPVRFVPLTRDKD
ncbi:MAG: protein-L-isoaspartate(D-aspartate) O-methyltransferase [Alphaproteobacteria bacterium]|nr:protein-L-isoaspartate(D-aspartate) O-methyltransferase [Alphaproteobacteria bacterium]